MSLLSSIFYFLYGYCVCLFVSILLDRKKYESRDAGEDDTAVASHPRFYINIFLTNSKEVLENIVRKKVSRKRRVLRALAKRVAVNLISDESLTGKIAEDLISSIPMKLGLIGVRATASLAYQQSAYICIDIELPSVDIVKLIEVNAGPAAAEKLAKMLEYIGIPAVTNMIESFMIKLIYRKIMTNLPQTIQEKLEDKLVAEVDIITLSEEEQGPFLIQTIQQLKESKLIANDES